MFTFNVYNNTILPNSHVISFGPTKVRDITH